MAPWRGTYFKRRRKRLRLSMAKLRAELLRKRRGFVPSLPMLYRELDGPDALGPRPDRRGWMIQELCRLLECKKEELWSP